MSSTITELLAPSEWLALGAMVAACLSALYSRWSAKAAIRSNRLSTLNALRTARAAARFAALKFTRRCSNTVFFYRVGNEVDPLQFLFETNEFRDEVDALGELEHPEAEQLLDRLGKTGMEVWKLLSTLPCKDVPRPVLSKEQRAAEAALLDIGTQLQSLSKEIKTAFARVPEAA